MGAALVGMTRRGALPSPSGPCWVGRDAAPAYGSGEAKRIEVAGVVVGDAGGEKGALPLDGRGLEAFELTQGFEDAFFAGECGWRLRGEVLPAEQPVHVDGGGDGFDLLAAGAEGEAMDALEDAALAPFNVVGSSVAGCSKAPRMRRPCISMARKALKTFGWDRGKGGWLGRRRWWGREFVTSLELIV